MKFFGLELLIQLLLDLDDVLFVVFGQLNGIILWTLGMLDLNNILAIFKQHSLAIGHGLLINLLEITKVEEQILILLLNIEYNLRDFLLERVFSLGLRLLHLIYLGVELLHQPRDGLVVRL